MVITIVAVAPVTVPVIVSVILVQLDENLIGVVAASRALHAYEPVAGRFT